MAIVVPLGQHLLRSHGNYVFPATTLTEVRIVLGASAVIALAAIIVIALAAIVRRPAAAITVGVAVFLLPIIVGTASGGGAGTWVLRLTPAAGLSTLQALTQYHQVSYNYTVANGYYPLSPLAGLAVLCGFALLATATAIVAVESEGRVSDAIRAEWTKLRTLPSTGWLLVAGAGITITVSAVAAAAWHVNAGGSADPTKISLTGIDVGQAVVAVLAVLAVSEEYGTGMIRTSLSAATPRLNFLAAKASKPHRTPPAGGLVAVAGSRSPGCLLLPSAGINPAHGYPLLSLVQAATLRAAVGSVLYLLLIALFSLGVANHHSRHRAASAATVIGLIYLPPLGAQLIQDPTWRRHLEQIGPMSAGLSIQATTHIGGLPISPWVGLGILAAWAAAALLVAGLLLQLRDA